MNTFLNREALAPKWFASCDVLCHEIGCDTPFGVQSHWKHVQALQGAIPGQVLCYHTPFLVNVPLTIVKEGQRYYLD